MATRKLKQQIADALVNNHGYGEGQAVALIEEHIDVVEVNEDDLTPEQIAEQIDEQAMQS